MLGNSQTGAVAHPFGRSVGGFDSPREWNSRAIPFSRSERVGQFSIRTKNRERRTENRELRAGFVLLFRRAVEERQQVSDVAILQHRPIVLDAVVLLVHASAVAPQVGGQPVGGVVLAGTTQ